MPERFVRVYRNGQLVSEVAINTGDDVVTTTDEAGHVNVSVGTGGVTALESIDTSIAESVAEPEPAPEPEPEPQPKPSPKKKSTSRKKSSAKS